jgi:hypothetical protein
MPAPRRDPDQRPQKTTLGQMRSTGLRKLLVYCGDYMRADSVTISAVRWHDDVRYRTLNRFLPARRAATVVPMSGHSSTHDVQVDTAIARMKFVADGAFTDPDAAARKLVEIAHSTETVQDGRWLAFPRGHHAEISALLPAHPAQAWLALFRWSEGYARR